MFNRFQKTKKNSDQINKNQQNAIAKIDAINIFSIVDVVQSQYVISFDDTISSAVITFQIVETTNYAKKIIYLTKMYIENMKYKKNKNNFQHKIFVFHNFCVKTDVLFETKLIVFSTMLKSYALIYYFNNFMLLKKTTFDQTCEFVKSHFENVDYQRNNLFKWNKTTLKSIMNKSKNQKKSTIECFNLLINELRKLQH